VKLFLQGIFPVNEERMGPAYKNNPAKVVCRAFPFAAEIYINFCLQINDFPSLLLVQKYYNRY